MSKRAEATCNECYFRRSGLCALQLEAPCPSFRHADRGALTPPQQARLIARPLRSHAWRVAEHQAA